MFTDELIKLLEKHEFISVATCDFKGRPNAVPKFLLKVEGDFIYLVDYTIGTTWKNLKEKHTIKPDTKLKALLGVAEGDVLTYFNLQRYLNRHYLKVEKPAATA